MDSLDVWAAITSAGRIASPRVEVPLSSTALIVGDHKLVPTPLNNSLEHDYFYIGILYSSPWWCCLKDISCTVLAGVGTKGFCRGQGQLAEPYVSRGSHYARRRLQHDCPVPIRSKTRSLRAYKPGKRCCACLRASSAHVSNGPGCSGRFPDRPGCVHRRLQQLHDARRLQSIAWWLYRAIVHVRQRLTCAASCTTSFWHGNFLASGTVPCASVQYQGGPGQLRRVQQSRGPRMVGATWWRSSDVWAVATSTARPSNGPGFLRQRYQGHHWQVSRRCWH